MHHHICISAQLFQHLLRTLPVLGLLALTNPRALAAELVWTNTAGGNWNVAANWNPNQVPAGADTAIITNAGIYTVTNNAAVTVSAIFLGLDTGTNPPVSFPQLRHTAGTLTVTNFNIATNGLLAMSSPVTVVSSLNCAGQVDQTASTLLLLNTGAINTYNLSGGEQRSGNLTVTNFNWTSGNLNSDGAGQKVIIASGGVLNYLGSAERYLSYYTPPGRGLDNHGTWNWSGPGNLRGNGGAVVNNYGAVNVSTNAQFNWGGSGVGPTWNNLGSFTRNGGTGFFYFNQVALTNSGNLNASAGTLSIYSTTFTGTSSGSINVTGNQLQFYASTSTNDGSISVGLNTLLTVDAGGTLGFGPNSTLNVPGTNNLQFNSGTTYLNTTNVTTPSALIAGGTLVQMAANQFPIVNESSGVWQLGVPCVLNTFNFTNGELRGRDLTVTNCNWFAGDMNSRTPGEAAGGAADRTIIPSGGVMNILGTANRGFSYYAGTGRGLDNHGTINWSAPILLRGNNGATVNNYGNVNVTGDSPNVQFYWYGNGAAPVWNNFGTLTRSTGTSTFYMDAAYLNNSGTINIQSGTFSIYASTATNLPGGSIQMAGGTVFQSESGSGLTLSPDSVVTHPDANGIRLISGSTYISTLNLGTPALWINGATVYQQTNIVVPAINESAGVLQLAVPCHLNTYNFTNGELRGRDLTVTNCNWFAGDMNSRAPSEAAGSAADRTIIPSGGVMNILGTANRGFSYYAGTGRGLDNYGTINWSAPILLRGNNGATVNNYGNVNVTGDSPNVQFYWYGNGAAPVWNNFGTLTRSTGTSTFYMDAAYLNNSGTIDIQSGTFSIYDSTLTNSTGVINMSAGTLFQSEAGSVVTLGAASQLVAPTANSIRLGGTSAAIETTNIISPTIWLQAGTLYQRTNIAVATINESGGALQLDVPCFLGLLNQTNGDVQGRNLIITNWNWYAGNHYRGTPGINNQDDRTIIPAGGTMNLLGTTARFLTYYSASGPSRTLDNYGTINWSGNAILYSYGLLNNYGTATVSATGTPQYAAYNGSLPPTWNNYGTFTRTNGTVFYFSTAYVNNSGLMDAQSGTLSIYASTFTNLAGGNILVQPGVILANDNGSASSFEAGSSLACADVNAFRINSGSVTLRTTGITAPSLWINGGTLVQATNNVVSTINESSGTLRLAMPVNLSNYNLTNGELRGANLTVDNFNWLGGNLNSDGPASNLVTVASSLNILGATAKSMSYYAAPGRTLINNGNAIWGGGTITFSGQISFVNNGNWNGTNDVTLGWTGTGAAAPLFQNNGTFTKSAGAGILTLGSTTFTNSGTVAINAGGLTVGGPFVQTAGSAFLGTNFIASSSVRVEAGSLTGKGNIAGAFYNNGSVNPGASPGFINGASFTNTVAAVYNVEIGGNTTAGTDYDQLRFSGPVTLDGTLNVSLYNNYALILSNRFTVLTTSARSGTFANVIPPPGVTFNTIYSTTNVVLEVAGLTNAPLEILTDPVSQTVWTPDPATFSVAVSGVTPITFQWQHEGTNLLNATNNSITIPAVAVADDGLYTVQITDGYGGTTNTSATLTVIPFANTIYWTNVLGGNWSVAANWLPNRVPNGTNNVVISTNGTYTVTVDVPAALSNLTVGAGSSTQAVNLISGQSLTVNSSTSWETNTIYYLNGLMQMNGGSNDFRGHIDWQLGTLSGAGRTVIATNGSLTFIGSLNQKFIATNILENYGTFNYGNDSFGNAQGLRFSGGAQLTNHPSGVISIGTAAYDYSGAQTPRSYFVNYGTINANSANVFSPTYISIDFINYGTLQNNGYTYLARGTNYGTFQFYNTLCEVSVFGDEGTGEYFSFEDGTTFVGAYPNLAVGGYAQWNTTAVHPGRVTVLSGSGGASFANPEFRVLKNYTQTGQTIVYKGRWTQANPALTADLNILSDGLVSGFHSFVISNAGTLNVNNFSHTVRNLANGGSILVRSNLTLAGSSYTYGGGSITINAGATGTFSGGTVEAQTVLNYGTNTVNGGLAFTGGTFYRNFAGAQTYFAGGSFATGPASVLNEGLFDGFGGISGLSLTNRATVLADDSLNRTLALGSYVQESGLTEMNPGNLSGNLDIQGGLFTGEGTVTGNLRNAAEVVPGNPFGLLSVTGNYTNAAGGTYFLPINGATPVTNFPQTQIGGTNVLAGTLYVNFTNGFDPVPGNLFTAMVFTARSGVFDSIVNDTYGLEAFYTPTTLVLRAENLLPNVTITVAGGNAHLVCNPFQFSASASDPDGTVTNLVLKLAGQPVASSTGATVQSQGESDSPMLVAVTATATDNRGGVRTVVQPVNVLNYSLTNVLFLGGIRTNDFKLCMVGEPNKNYEIYASTNLATTNWVDIGMMTETNGTWRYIDPLTITNRPHRFYRALQLP